MGRRDGIAERAGVQEKFLAHLLMQGAGTLRGFFFHVPLNGVLHQFAGAAQ